MTSASDFRVDGKVFAPPRRLAPIDALRGAAILAMIAYHVGWDLFFLGLIATDVTSDPAWVAFQRGIVTSFLLLVGAGLVLAHGKGVRWSAFGRRLAVIAGAALLVTLGTFFVFPDYFVFFGILHAIALFSLLALPFAGAPLPVVAAAARLFLLPPAFLPHTAFTEKWLGWIGFWPVPPMTTDIVPIFPWFGVVLLGIAAMRLILSSPWRGALEAARLDGPVGRTLRLAGRWSLVIYLVHQPLIYGGLSLLAQQLAK